MSEAKVRRGIRGPHIAAFLAAAIALTACVTHRLDQAQRPRWETVFERNKDELTLIVNDLIAGKCDVDQEGRVSVPHKRSDICCVERRDAFVFFTLKTGWLDDPTRSLVFDLDGGRPSTRAVRALFELLDRPLYHLQHVENGWYYCEYN